MTDQQQRFMAARLAEDSNVFDFDRALEFVRHKPAEAERLIREQEEMRKRQEERARALERMQMAIREEFG
jgi:hypothetical protein